MREPLRVLLIEDEALLLMQLETFLEDEGHIVAGTATSLREAVSVAAGLDADIALVDVHLADGPTGVEVAQFISEQTGMAVVFMTANPGRIPADFSGALGVIAKPYTQEGFYTALNYLNEAVRDPPPSPPLPTSLTLAPTFAQRWNM